MPELSCNQTVAQKGSCVFPPLQSDGSCTPYLARLNKPQFECCDHYSAAHFFGNNCCCTTYWFVSDKKTIEIRNIMLISLLVAYGVAVLVLCYRIWDSYRVSLRATRVQSISDFLTSRKFVLNLASIAAMIFGICSVTFHTFAFNCFGGVAYGTAPDQTAFVRDSDDCRAGGPNPEATALLYAFLPFDALANIALITSKIIVLQKCLHIVRIGSSKVSAGPSVPILTASVWLTAASFICWFVTVVVSSLLSRDPKLGKKTEILNLSLVFFFGALSFVVAMFCAFIHNYHTNFHLKLYLASLKARDSQFNHDDEQDAEDVKSKKSKFNQMHRFMKSLSGNLRRLQIAVVLILCSFVVKATLYLTLTINFSFASSLQSAPCQAEASYVNITSFCDRNYQPQNVISASTILGSPLVFPLISLFSDPLLMMCVSNPNTTPNPKLKPVSHSFFSGLCCT
jgi:hypothetical protein